MSEPIESTARTFRYAVIGGGIAGLTAAHRLHELDPTAQVTLFEASDRLGGVLRTDEVDGYLIERSADSFITKPPIALEFCRRIGFADELIGTDTQNRAAYVVHRGRLVKLPDGFALMTATRLWPILTTPLLSLPGKARLAMEPLVRRRRANNDESFASFARRRLGREAYENLVQPLVSGIYTADPERLSMQAALPRFFEMERQHGSLFQASRHERGPAQSEASGVRYQLFVTPRRGLRSLVEAIAARLPPGRIELNQAVTRVKSTSGGGFQVELAEGAARKFDGVIVSAPTSIAAELVESIVPAAASDLRRIEHAGCAIAMLGCRRDQIAHPLDGFGFVVPEVERRKILSASFSSVKYAGRAPHGRVLIRVFLGGACHPEIQALDDAEMKRVVLQELGELIGLSGEPELFQVTRWDRKMPQYHVGHCELVQRIEHELEAWPALALAGNGYRGVGIPQCIAEGERAAERIASAVTRGQPPR